MIHISGTILAKMTTHSEQLFPYECCGFFYGKEDEAGNRHITETLEVNNAVTENKERRFYISPQDYMKAEKFALENDRELLGVYHSHPDYPAIPSETDRLSAQPWFSYVIVSVMKGKFAKIKSWRLNDNQQFEEEALNDV